MHETRKLLNLQKQEVADGTGGVWMGGVDRDERRSTVVQQLFIILNRCIEPGKIPLRHNLCHTFRNTRRIGRTLRH